MALTAEQWFPSVIWSGMMDGVDNAHIETFAQDRKQLDEGVQVSNYIGWQSGPIRQGDSEEFDKLVRVITEQVNGCAVQADIPELAIQNIWVNVNTPGSYNHLHNHAGSILSGVYYVDAENQGNIQFERNDGGEYHIPYDIAQETYYTSTRATYAAKTNALYIFPGWLKHSVQGNIGTTDRISVSFNYGEKK